MTFTDEDLKELKAHIKECISMELTTAAPARKIKALLHRLECAELIICSYSQFDYDEDRGLLVKKWLRSKGVKGA